MAKRKRKYYETILEMIEEERRGVPIEESFRKLNKSIASKTRPSKLSIAEKEYKDAIRSGASDITVQSKLNALNAIKSGREKKDDGRRWFQKGAFEDGYQIGDISKTIIGTGKDFLDDAATGAIKLGEGIFDMGTYLVGGAADLFGADDFAEKTKKFAARDITNEFDLGAGAVKTLPIGDIFTKANDFINKGDDENTSLFGEKMDSLVQSAGQLAGTAGLQMVGVPWWITTGASSFGTAAEEAFQNDATYAEAGGYGLIKGGADVLTEKIFGGIKFKGKAFDDAFKQTLTQGISNKAVKTMTKLGWDMAGEGTEEVLAEVIGNVGKKLSYEDEKTWKELLTSEEAMDNYLESFIGGAALGGGFNVKKAHNSIKTGRDYDTGLSDNERKVVDSEIKNRTTRIQKERAIKQQVDQIIAEREKTFGKLNNSQKENIKDAVISKLESGEIDYSISKLDKKEIAKIETEVIDDLKSGYIGIGTIEDVLAGDKTATLRDLKERLENTTDNTKKAEIEAEINRITGEKATQLKRLLKKDVILQESYVQEALKGKEFSREATKEDSDITKELIESAKAAKMNDTRAMHTLFDYTSKIANETNTKYGFTNNEQLTELGYSAKGKTINGLVRKNEDGTTKILINVDSDKALNSIIGHETTHLLEGTNEYEALQEMVKEYATTKGEYDSRYKELSELYKGVDANLENEITSDLVGDYLFTDEQFINSLSIKEPNVFKRIYDYVKHAFKMATAGSKEARQLEQVKQRFEKAYRGIEKSARKAETASNLTTESNIDNIKYSQNKDSGITYTKLISKPDMPISMVTTTLKDITDKSRKEIVDAARKKLPKQNNNGQVTIHNKDTGMDIVIGKPSLEHGLGRNYEYTAMVSMHLEDYLRNAIKINEAVADGNRKHDSDILLGYGQTESGEKIPAYFVVSKLTTGQKELVEFGSLYSIKAKKIVEDSARSSQAFQGPTSTKISISALLDIVNETYSDILPKTVAEHYGNKRRKTKLGESVRFSLKNKNITEDTKISFVIAEEYIDVPKNNKAALSELQNKVKQLPRGTYENKATGYKADINRVTIGKIINPSNNNRYGQWSKKYINNLNAALSLPQLFENAVYLDTIGNQKSKNANKEIKGFHHFIAPLHMNGEDYRVRIVAREKENSDTLYIVETDILTIKDGVRMAAGQKPPTLGATPSIITIPDLIKDVKIYDYDMQKNVIYSDKDIKFSLSAPVEETKELVKEEKQSSQTAKFSLRNKNITEDTPIPYVVSDKYIHVNKNNRIALSYLQDEVKKLPRGTYENKATGYKADINSNTINKALKPTHKEFNEYGANYIRNLNAILNLPELFKNALYVDTIKNQKDKNLNKKIKGFHHFIAPLKMNGEDYRALITAREKENSDSIYVLRVEVMPMKKKMPQVATSSIGSQFTEASSTVTIPDLIKDVKIYDYDMQKNIEYTKDDIKFSLSELIKDGEEDSNSDVIYNALSEEDLAAYEQERDEAFRRIPDDYMPDEDSEYYNPPDVTPLDDGYLKLVSKNIRKVLNLKNNQIPALKKIIQDYSTSENQDPESLYKLIKDEFGKVAERNKLQDISEVKAFIRQTGIRVSDYIKSEIPDYASWKQKQFGKMKIAADGLEVDDVYEGLKDVYPQFFPENIINPAEQLMQISEVVGMNDTVIEKYSIPEEDIQFAADFIYDSVYDYKQQKRLEYAMQDDIAPVNESRIPHNLFDNGDIAPVKSNFDSNDFSKSVGVQQKYDAKTETITESERDVETERLELKKKQAIEDLGSLEEYTSRKADELYQEVRTMRKGKQASKDLGYILDHLFVGIDKESAEYDRKKDRIYKNITDTLIRMSKNPNKPERPRGYVESIIREAIESRYRWDIAAINAWELDPVAKTRRELRRNLINKDPEFMKKALSSAKNRNRLFMNNTDTIRTTELVFGRENGKIINDMIFQKAIDNEADSIAWQNKERKEIAALGIKAKDKFGKVTKESAAVQKYGEGKYLDDNGEYVIYDDEALEKEFENPDDRAKIINAARVIRQKYDEYIDKANEVLTSLKFDPIPKRDDYMRHFQVLNDKFSQFGIPFNPQSMQEHVLPTDINGLTEFWSPQKNYFANLRPREGMRTTLDAITGIDGYISGIANLIYHTEDIQRGRAFEELIRETFGEDKGWENLKELPEEEQAERIEQIRGKHLSRYAAWLHEWTNNLAGKKSKKDRAAEEDLDRKGFTILDEMGKGTSATMLGFNLSSALTNLIAPVQAMAKTNKAAVLRGTADTIKNIFIKDSFMEDNRFLTARMGTEMLSKRPWDKIRDTGFIFMKGMDWFASNQIVRSKYYELKSKGLSDEEAHAGAGQFAARIMGDRTKGAMPQLYNSKVFNILAQFQLEVNNQLYSMFYDTYHESRESAKERAGSTAAGMVFTLGQLFTFTHIFGKTFEAIAGYNPTFDVISILATALGIGDDDDDEKTPMERLQKAADMLLDALPYSSLLSDGGRIPVTNMLPDIMGILTGSEDEYGRKKTMASEGKKILPYLLPTGGNQIKKTIGGLKMFSDDLPVTGSYTDKGDLRFPVKGNPANVVQAAIFGQWANKNAREYFDKEVGIMDGNEIEEYRDLNIPISDYWKYREELRSKDSAAEKIEYINSLDLSVRKKNIMVNNRIKRENSFDLKHYDDFGSYEEFKFATDHPEEYLIARASGGYTKYEKMKFMLGTIKADKDDYGKSISGSRKEKIINFLNSSSTMDYGEKLILFKKQYPADDTYNYEIIDYLNSRDDINYKEMRTILTELGFMVDLQGNISW